MLRPLEGLLDSIVSAKLEKLRAKPFAISRDWKYGGPQLPKAQPHAFQSPPHQVLHQFTIAHALAPKHCSVHATFISDMT
jgi:hypothetical protein